MVRSLLVSLLFLSVTAHAQFFGFGGSNKFSSRIPALMQKMRKLEMTTTPGFEDTFNKSVKELEVAAEEEKLYCSGEATDSEGKSLPTGQKELCFRELKKHYLEAMETIFEMKKKYLDLLHAQQIRKLIDVHKKLTSDIEKNF